LNLNGLSDPTHDDRKTVDLLFFPTGGGKTEAYLSLAAFQIAYRRLTSPDWLGSGVCVIMRYTFPRDGGGGRDIPTTFSRKGSRNSSKTRNYPSVFILLVRYSCG